MLESLSDKITNLLYIDRTVVVLPTRNDCIGVVMQRLPCEKMTLEHCDHVIMGVLAIKVQDYG